jgi:Tfp pilus assembly protein PilX
MKQIHTFGKSRIGHGGQRGGLTIFSAALILILLTIALLYATQVSLFESRISGNEVRQKGAFHVAEAVLEQSTMFLLANSNVILSSRDNVFPDGTDGSFTKDGWLPGSSNPRWALCPSNPAATHPCGGDVEAKAGSYYYDTDGDTTTFESLPVNETDFPVGATARVSALMCFVDIDDTSADCGAAGTPTSPDFEANSTLVITMLAYGYSDCTDVTNVATCTGRATIAKPVGTDKKLGGSPAVPLVAKSTVPLDGTFEVVGNPNGGGVGVPLTTWMDADSDLLSSGSWQTCEMEEWYHVSEQPEGVACTDNNCLCGPGGNDTSYFLSYRAGGGDTHIGIDIIQDPDFPPDLFELFFTVPRSLYTQVKDDANTKKIDAADCETLGPGSSGLIWVNGGDCRINGNSTIGSPQAPVLLVSAADLTTINAGAVIFGVVYIFDDDPAGHGALLKTTGTATIYGACIVDGEIDKLQGTFQVVYNSAVLATAAGVKGVGAINGGWRDFGLPDIAW